MYFYRKNASRLLNLKQRLATAAQRLEGTTSSMTVAVVWLPAHDADEFNNKRAQQFGHTVETFKVQAGRFVLVGCSR